MATSYDLGPESLLGIPDGEDAQTLRDRLDLALRYIANWYKATADSDNKQIWWPRIDQVRAKVEAAFKLADPAELFVGNKGVNAYNDAANAFPGLWRDLTLSADTLPEPSLLDIAAGLGDTLLETPGYLLTAGTNAITKSLGGALGSALGNLWPDLLLAGGVWAAIEFGPVLAAYAKKAVG